MSSSADVQRLSVWEDRFRRPSAPALVRALAKHHAALVTHARSRILELGGIVEEAVWLGVPWKWTLVYRRQTLPDAGTPAPLATALAFIIPQPARPQLCIPVQGREATAQRGSAIVTAVRHAVGKSVLVGNIRWPSWDLTGKGQIEAALELLRERVASERDTASSRASG